MTEPRKPLDRSSQPPLADLLSQFLQRQASAQASGLAAYETSGEVVPFDAAPTRPVDARLAWDGAIAAVRYLHPDFPTRTWQAPADWPAVVAARESAASVAFCLGNFPQMVHALQPLLTAADMSTLRPTGTPVAPSAAAQEAGDSPGKSFPHVFLGVALLRLAGKFDEAQEWIRSHQQHVPPEWQAAWENEKAALAWHHGRAEEAAKMWQAQPPSVPVLFNRGMAALFLNQMDQARSHLAEAVAQIPEDDAWHHLGRLYLALAQMRR